MVVLSNSIKPTDPQHVNNLEILRTKHKKPYNKEEVSLLIKAYRCD